jgi:nitroreductase
VAAAEAVPVPGGHRFPAVPVPAAARAACLAVLSPAPPVLATAPALLACGLGRPAGEEAPGVELAAGGAVRTLVLGLHALGVGAVFEPTRDPALAAALGLDPGWRPLGLLAAGRPG